MDQVAEATKKTKRKTRAKTKEKKAPKKLKLGLALSGGGFRATAFHLGVLKRLRELGVLQKTDVLSTVSGGSIVGAFWVYWQALRGDTLADEQEWNNFETKLVELMQSNLRGRVLLWCAIIPAVVALLLAYLLLRIFELPTVFGVLIAVAVAYVFWRTFSSHVLVRYYDKWMFDGANLGELSKARKGRKKDRWPRLLVNATALGSGRQILFTEKPRSADMLMQIFKSIPFIGGFLSLLDPTHSPQRVDEDERPIIQALEDFSIAVAASSAVPGIFPPHKIGGAWDYFVRRFRRRTSTSKGKKNRGDKYIAVDGGAYDNQGIYALLGEECDRIMVSDAAAALRPLLSPPTLHLGVLRRAQAVIYEWVRRQGYLQLLQRHNLYRIVERVIAKQIGRETATRWRKEVGQVVEDYCYIELLPARQFDWQKGLPRVPRRLHEHIAGIRTDLDRFSDMEISALMYHGYTLIDHCLKAYNKTWISRRPSNNFTTAVARINIDWDNLSEEQLKRYEGHLKASASRFALWRHCLRVFYPSASWVSEQEWWRTISPTWKKSKYVATWTPEGGETVTTTEHVWQRRNVRKAVRKWTKRRWRKFSAVVSGGNP